MNRFAWLFVLLLTGCASGLPAISTDKRPFLTSRDNASHVRDLEVNQTRFCSYVGTVSGSSGLFTDSSGLLRAKLDARAKALQLGATHVVWTQVEDGLVSKAQGKAYDCKHQSG